jgi:hypothetical protein
MTTDELLKALAPYGVELSYKVVPAQWRVLLMAWEFFTVYGDTPLEALQAAWVWLKPEVRDEKEQG